MEKVNDYEAPVVEIVEVEVEKGFAVSDLYPESGNWLKGGYVWEQSII